jgi:hypothetical protein
MTSLVVAFVVVSARPTAARLFATTFTGIVAEFDVGRRIVVARRDLVCWWHLSETTIYETRGQVSGLDRATIVPGVQVRVWVEGDVGTADYVVHKLRVLTDAPPR